MFDVPGCLEQCSQHAFRSQSQYRCAGPPYTSGHDLLFGFYSAEEIQRKWLTIIHSHLTLKSARRAVVFARGAAGKSFLPTAPFTSQARIPQGRFRCGRVRDVVMKKLASGASLLEKRSTN